MSPNAPRPSQTEAAHGRQAIDGSPIYTVSELTSEIRDALERHLGLVWVRGEISNLRRPASGHCYFTLKDEFAQINVVMWRTLAAGLKFELKDGLSLLVQGELTVYEPRGQYQIVLKRAEPLGVGALQLAFLQLKDKLAREGLFDSSRKKPLPRIPRRIAVVTSPTGAAVRDILTVIARRFPPAHVTICPVRVQGDEAAAEIALTIGQVNRLPRVDVMIVGRGGGSLEDIWSFNEEIVARAIAASQVPVISAVGHETDFTIADFVADVRALTPTDAGNLVVPDIRRLAADMSSLAGRLGQALLARIAGAREWLDGVSRSYAMRRPFERIRVHEQRLDDLAQQLFRDIAHIVQIQHQRVEAAAARLESLNPVAVLERGYSITFHEPEGKLVRSTARLKVGDLVRTRLARGEFVASVEGKGRTRTSRRRT